MDGIDLWPQAQVQAPVRATSVFCYSCVNLLAWWNDKVTVLFDRSSQVTDFVDLAGGSGAGSEKQKTVILGESFGAMLGIRLGQLR